MLKFFKKQRAAKLLKEGEPRRIRVHSVKSEPADAPRPKLIRVAFEFLDPPGPWTIQFFEAEPSAPEAIEKLKPGVEAVCYESEDKKATRVMKTSEGEPIWPY